VDGLRRRIQRITEIERVANGKPSHFRMDEAFCARVRAAIAAGLEKPPTGVVSFPAIRTADEIFASGASQRWQSLLASPTVACSGSKVKRKRPNGEPAREPP